MDEQFKLIVGLGNYGKEYEYTRHNLGFLTVDAYLKEFFPDHKWQKKFDAEYSKIKIDNEERFFIKPQTYMNLSGKAVRSFLQFYKLEPSQMIVIHDEADLEEGIIRLKKAGGAGGHNGLLSIFEDIGSQDFYRIRIGVGKRKPTEDGIIGKIFKSKGLAGYLLEGANKKKLLELAKQGSQALQDVFVSGFTQAQMNQNTRE